MVKFPFFVAGHVIKVGVRRRDVRRMYYALYHPIRIPVIRRVLKYLGLGSQNV